MIAISANAVRHLFLVLLVPDKRGFRTVAGTAGMATHLLPSVVLSGAANYIIMGLLWLALGYYLAHRVPDRLEGSAESRGDSPPPLVRAAQSYRSAIIGSMRDACRAGR